MEAAELISIPVASGGGGGGERSVLHRGAAVPDMPNNSVVVFFLVLWHKAREFFFEGDHLSFGAGVLLSLVLIYLGILLIALLLTAATHAVYYFFRPV